MPSICPIQNRSCGKLKTMITDPARVRRTDPGNPDVCPVYDFHKIFSPLPVIEQVNRDCRTAAIGCIDCKKLVADRVVDASRPCGTPAPR